MEQTKFKRFNKFLTGFTKTLIKECNSLNIMYYSTKSKKTNNISVTIIGEEKKLEYIEYLYAIYKKNVKKLNKVLQKEMKGSII